MRCEKCQVEVAKEEAFQHGGQTLCEDCYIETISRPQPCDPGAVSAAKAARELQGQKGLEGLTPVQKKIYNYLKEKGKATQAELAEYMQMSPDELQGHFAVLRHCELARGCKEGNKVYFTLM
ncbi:MAG: winged helix-turn-helix domain-containing protein [Syntrophaceticus sp.]